MDRAHGNDLHADHISLQVAAAPFQIILVLEEPADISKCLLLSCMSAPDKPSCGWKGT